MKKFRAGKAAIGCAHPQSLGHGVDGLQDVTNILTIFGWDWNLETYMQLIERIGPTRQMQSGHKRSMFLHRIIARDRMDEVVAARHESKRSVQDLLLESMKRNRNKS